MISPFLILALIFVLGLQYATADLPDCHYYDTVNITAGERFSNGSFLFEGLLIPAHLMGEYDFRVMADNSMEPEMKHWRGCVCQLKSCIRLCCHHYNLLQDDKCNRAEEEQMDRLDPYLNVTLEDGSEVRRHFRSDFVVQSDLPRPCADFNHLDNRDAEDGYTLFQNGSLLLHSDGKFLNKMEYCLQPYIGASDDPLGIRIVPHNCREASKIVKTVGKGGLTSSWVGLLTFVLFHVFPSKGMVLSLVCMLISIAVYLYVKKLHNLHGKCFVSYMICLFIVYLILLLDLWQLSMPFCAIAGYIGYYFVMAAFLWLSVISLHLWFNLGSRRISRFSSEYPFLAYNLYAWGVAGLLTGIVYGVDHLVEDNPVNESWMPGVGFYICWINTFEWSAMIYFYGPMLLLIIFNITMFVLTAKRILATKRELQSFNDLQQRKQKHNSDRQTFFLRLFVIMGVSWSLEIVSYLVRNNGFWRKIFLAADYLNLSQGILIFVMFILKRSTLRLIVER
ncbi:hypothetical protein KR009_009686 [Drosophila setifemur]|nr:hypothetical protein KR009_009686 [Drosophila setifemur]